MNPPAFDPAEHVERMAALLGLTIAPEWKEAVIAHLTANARAAELVMGFPLEDHVEPASVFEP